MVMERFMRAHGDLCAMRPGYARSERFMRDEAGVCALRSIYAR